jgi:type II secretory pathway predicted ATPase ExeA
MSYEQFFGLTEQPFSNAPDSRFYYDSPQHQEAMIKIMHAVETMKGLVVMLGEIGAGKTLLARKVLEKLEDNDQYVESLLVIVHSEVSASWILKRIASQIGIENPSDDKAVLLPQFFKKLMEIYESGKKAVVLVDEANMLKSKEIFEEFRGLLNLEIPGRKLISIVLIGLPELEENIALDPPLAQRTAIKFRLRKLDLESTRNYIKHRLKVAGASREIFSESSIDAIFDYSKGTPRIINTVCDNALLEAFLMKKDYVDKEIIGNVCEDLGTI